MHQFAYRLTAASRQWLCLWSGQLKARNLWNIFISDYYSWADLDICTDWINQQQAPHGRLCLNIHNLSSNIFQLTERDGHDQPLLHLLYVHLISDGTINKNGGVLGERYDYCELWMPTCTIISHLTLCLCLKQEIHGIFSSPTTTVGEVRTSVHLEETATDTTWCLNIHKISSNIFQPTERYSSQSIYYLLVIWWCMTLCEV